MFDVGWSEIMVIATVAIVVVGPKELPRMLRTFGKTMGQVRRTANDFKRQFNDALREAEREAGLDDTKKELAAMSRLDPLRNAKKDFDAAMRSGGGSNTAVKPASAVAVANAPKPDPAAPKQETAATAEPAATATADPAAPAAAPLPQPVAETATAEASPAEPVKVGTVAERGSDAA
jgi:sec-independent protein translocase protein TatB